MVSRPSPAPLPPALPSPLWPLHGGDSWPVPHPQEAFWCLVQICELYLPGYYGPHMVRVWDGARGHKGRDCVGGWVEAWGLRRAEPAGLWEWRC